MYKANVIGAVSYHEKYFYGSLCSVIWSITNQIDGADKCAFNWIYPVRQLPYIYCQYAQICLRSIIYAIQYLLQIAYRNILRADLTLFTQHFFNTRVQM